MTKKERHWNDQQIKDFAKQILERWGSLWLFVGGDVRSALVDAKVAQVAASQNADKIAISAIDELRERLRKRLDIDQD